MKGLLDELNGARALFGWMAALASVCVIIGSVGSYYAGWRANVDQSVTQRQMVNAHDETLQAIVPKVETCHTVNERQDVALNFAGESNARQDREIAALTEQVTRTHDMIQFYLQSMMKRGEIPR